MEKPKKTASRRCAKCLMALAVVIAVPLLLVAYLVWRFGTDSPVAYANIEQHFKYGSTGGGTRIRLPLLDMESAAGALCGQAAGQGI